MRNPHWFGLPHIVNNHVTTLVYSSMLLAALVLAHRGRFDRVTGTIGKTEDTAETVLQRTYGAAIK